MTRGFIASVAVLAAISGCSTSHEACGPGTVNLNGVCVEVDAGPFINCGVGTTLVGGQCVAVQCGAGSTLVDGQCVALDAGPGVVCGAGTHLVDGQCVALDAGPGVICGGGTVLSGGQCIAVDAGPGLMCGPGTVAVNGECVLISSLDAGPGDAGTGCTAANEAAIWAAMLQQPIRPPRYLAGLDLANGDAWTGLTIDQAETSSDGGLCPATLVASGVACPSGTGLCNTSAWGSGQQVLVNWRTDTHLIDQVALQSGSPGYYGTLTATSRDGAHTYTIQIGTEIQKDGQPFPINWDATPIGASDNPNVAITELFNAVMNTYAAEAGLVFPTDSTDCGADGNCLIYNSGATAIFGFRPLAIYFQSVGAGTQPGLSTPTSIFTYPSARPEPYGVSPFTLKIDPEGPVAQATPTGASSTDVCMLKIGETFADFNNNCLEPVTAVPDGGMPGVGDLTRFLKGVTHDAEHFTPSIQGINQSFTSTAVQSNPNQVLTNADTIQQADVAQTWSLNPASGGVPINDVDSNGDLNFRGSAMVFIEWANLMRQDVARILTATTGTQISPTVLGDPRCTGFTGAAPTYVATNASKPICSGLEGLIIPGNPANGTFVNEYGASCDLGNDVNNPNSPSCLDPGINWDSMGFFYRSSVLVPGGLTATFCADPGSWTDCTPQGESPFEAAQQWVTKVLGRGSVGNLPAELQDVGYYFKWYAIAYVQYLKAYGNYGAQYEQHVNQFPDDSTAQGSGLGPLYVYHTQIDLESLVLTSSAEGNGQSIDSFEYTDRTSIGQGSGGSSNFIPWGFALSSDVVSGSEGSETWSRRMTRPEIALLSAMLTNKSHTAGQENDVNPTNLFGSPVLTSLWPTYECAVGQAGDPHVACNDMSAPLDTTNPSGAASCDWNAYPNTGCSALFVCVVAPSHTNGDVSLCAPPCDFTTYSATGCASPTQTCAIPVLSPLVSAGFPVDQLKGCVDMALDQNGSVNVNGAPFTPAPLLASYPGAWTRSPLGMGLSPVTLPAAGQQPDAGLAEIDIPNFVNGPYTDSPQARTGTPPTCPSGWTLDAAGEWCTAPVNTGTDCDVVNPASPPGTPACNLAPAFKALAPWLAPGAGGGFSHTVAGASQFQPTGQFTFSGVFANYTVDYLPYVDTVVPSCAAASCRADYTCDAATSACVATNGNIQVLALQSPAFPGGVFLCADPQSGDVLMVHEYDTVSSISAWLAAHPGGLNQLTGEADASAQSACGIVIDQVAGTIESTTNGVVLAIGASGGTPRVVGVTLYDPTVATPWLHTGNP